MLILVINCGSSSAKYQLFDIGSMKVRAKGAVERIGEKGSVCKSYHQAIRIVKERLLKDAACIGSLNDIKGIGHRVVHGGEDFSRSVIIDRTVERSIEKASELAPLHNPPSLAGIRASRQYFPGIPQVAVFDTAFHHSMPEHAYIYGIPYGFYKKYRIRRYGFHGTSHRFVAGIAAKRLGKPLGRLRLITVHLGNGCSMAAVLRGRSIDTTMGLTPLEGLLMGTRSGDLDPAIVTYLMKKDRLSLDGINELLNKKSGLLGISGVSKDMRDILGSIKKGNKRSKLAYDIFLYRIKKYIGAYAACMGGIDAVVFTGGIGENVPRIMGTLSKELRPLFGRRVRFITVPTNEELLIARDTCELIRNRKNSA
ncbi:MAG: acetate kinase [Candidatus Omnitrophota bacterium]